MPTRNLLNQRLAEGVRRVGFRKWYTRELLSSHAHMVLALLCSIALIGSLELLSEGSTGTRLLNAALFLLSAGVGLWAMRRYLYLLMHAEQVANQAICPQCQTYGRFAVVDEDQRSSATRVRCRHCQHDWVIEP